MTVESCSVCVCKSIYFYTISFLTCHIAVVGISRGKKFMLVMVGKGTTKDLLMKVIITASFNIFLTRTTNCLL